MESSVETCAHIKKEEEDYIFHRRTIHYIFKPEDTVLQLTRSNASDLKVAPHCLQMCRVSMCLRSMCLRMSVNV